MVFLCSERAREWFMLVRKGDLKARKRTNMSLDNTMINNTGLWMKIYVINYGETLMKRCFKLKLDKNEK